MKKIQKYSQSIIFNQEKHDTYLWTKHALTVSLHFIVKLPYTRTIEEGIESNRWRHICANGHSCSDRATGDVISAPMDTADQTALAGGPEMWLYWQDYCCSCSLISWVLLVQIWPQQPPCHCLHITYYILYGIGPLALHKWRSNHQYYM